MNLNTKQIIAIILVILGVITASTAQLTDIFGPTSTKLIIAVGGMLNSVLAGVLGVITSQTGTLKDVQSMPGVDKIVVNEKASPALATLAIDPANAKIEAKPSAIPAVNETARNG